MCSSRPVHLGRRKLWVKSHLGQRFWKRWRCSREDSKSKKLGRRKIPKEQLGPISGSLWSRRYTAGIKLTLKRILKHQVCNWSTEALRVPADKENQFSRCEKHFVKQPIWMVWNHCNITKHYFSWAWVTMAERVYHEQESNYTQGKTVEVQS